MLKNKQSYYALIFILIIIIGIEITGLLCSPSPPPHQYNQNETQQKNYTTGTPILSPIFSNTRRGLDCILDWVGTNSDAVIALATIAIAFFTFTLWITSQEHSRHMKASIAAAEKAAEAAKKSADALPAIERAYLFVKVKIEDVPDTNVEVPLNKIPERVNIIITNHGKTPALLVDIRNIIFPDRDDAPIEKVVLRIQSIPDTESWIPSGTVIIDSGKTRSIPGNIFITDEQRQEIKSLSSTLFCIGRIKYKDIFGSTWETGFCWKYEPFRAFIPIENHECNYHT